MTLENLISLQDLLVEYVDTYQDGEGHSILNKVRSHIRDLEDKENV